MHTIQFNANHSLGVIGRIILILAAIVAAAVYLREPILQFYLEDTLTEVGLAINGAIVGLFALGLLVLFWQLFKLNREERALAQFFKNIQSNASRPMSTALSTTVTAIVCFLIFGYAYIKSSDAQTRLIATVEAVTLESLMPRFHISAESVNAEVTQLVQALQEVVKQINDNQQRAHMVEQQIEKSFQGHDARMAAISSHIRSLENLLKQGFRLHPSE